MKLHQALILATLVLSPVAASAKGGGGGHGYNAKSTHMAVETMHKSADFNKKEGGQKFTPASDKPRKKYGFFALFHVRVIEPRPV